MAEEGSDAVVQVFFIRGGRMIGRDHFYLRTAPGETKAEILDSFIKQYYAGTPFIPGELMLSEELEDVEVLKEWLSAKRGGKVDIRVPQKGTKEKLVELAADNARMVLTKDKERLTQGRTENDRSGKRTGRTDRTEWSGANGGIRYLQHERI